MSKSNAEESPWTFSWNVTEENEDTNMTIHVVRESKYFNGEWVDINRPQCFSKFVSAKNWAMSKVNEIVAKRKFELNEKVSVENIASSETMYITLRDSSRDFIARYEIYKTPLFTC
jgi:hypothetical protein